MHFYFHRLILWISIAMVCKLSHSMLNLQSDPPRTILKLCEYGNNSCLNDVLVQKFIVFNADAHQNVSVKLGKLERSLTLDKRERFSSRIYTERRVFLAQPFTSEIAINTICEFTYDNDRLPYIDDSFCCRVDLELGSDELENPYALCELKILPKPTYCFIPVKMKNVSFNQDKSFLLTSKVYRKKAGSCDHQPLGNSIYATAPSLIVSFTHNLPVVWKLSSMSPSKILIGSPLHSTSVGEHILVPVRLLSTRANLDNQIIIVQCAFDGRFYFNAAITNYPNVSVVNNFTFVIDSHYYINLKLKITPRLDQQLMFLNLTVVLDSTEGDTINSAKLKCCINPTDTMRQKKSVCKNGHFVDIPLKQSYSMPIIPAINDTTDMFSIYSVPTVDLQSQHMTVYGITNYKDKIVKNITDANHLTISNVKNPSDINHMRYQTFLNPWSMRIHFYQSVHTILSPVRVWRSIDWKLMLSNNVLQPIKNWAVPESFTDNAVCVPRYTVAQLKILCRLYIVDETGERRYVGYDGRSNEQIPYVDVTSMTNISQLKIINDDVISLHKPPDRDHFLLFAKQVGQHSDVQLTSLDSKSVLASTRVIVDLRDLYVVDLIVHCVDVLLLTSQNRTVKSITKPNEYDSITVSLKSSSLSKPCYLVVFVVYSDNSVERISTINQNQYRLIVTRSESGGIIDTPIKDSQQVIIRHLPHVNMSLYEPSSCRDSRLVFMKKIEWVAAESVIQIKPVTAPPAVSLTTAKKNNSYTQLLNNVQLPALNPVHISIYICTGIVAFCFIAFVLYKLFCYHSRSRDNNSSSSNYQRSGSTFMDDTNMKVPIRSPNSKNGSGLTKCNTNCLRQNASKSHSNEPYPPLLPPPGPIAANYDISIIDQVCSDSAVDSGVEIGKLSSYSSNTCPSNDLCCTIDLYPSSSVNEDLHHQPYPPPQFANPMMGYYSSKGIIEPENPFPDTLMLSSLNSSKAISNLRHPYW